MVGEVCSLGHHHDVAAHYISLPKQQCWAEQALLANIHTEEVGWAAVVGKAEVAGMRR